MRDESVGWTVESRRGPRTGRGQPGAARGGLQEPARARPGLRGGNPAQRESAPAGLKIDLMISILVETVDQLLHLHLHWAIMMVLLRFMRMLHK